MSRIDCLRILTWLVVLVAIVSAVVASGERRDAAVLADRYAWPMPPPEPVTALPLSVNAKAGWSARGCGATAEGATIVVLDAGVNVSHPGVETSGMIPVTVNRWVNNIPVFSLSLSVAAHRRSLLSAGYSVV